MEIPILLPNIFNHPFTYKTNIKLKIGDFVEVPFGKKNIIGVVWDEFEKKSQKTFKIKSVIRKVNIPSLKIETIKFLDWFSQYNLIPKGMALKLVLMSGQAIEKLPEKEYENFNSFENKLDFKLTNEQEKNLKEINKNINKFRVHVLQGVTGSGKTLVYFETIRKVIEKKKQALILLPEIGLTNQFEKKFIEFFGFQPAIWHSGISKKNKKKIWSGIINNKIKVAIGARSSLFLPFKNLGLIIVDEEHDQSYKQDEGVIYNARDMAIARANFENIPINLVTAVPSIETYENIRKGKYSISKLSERFKKASLPNHEIINLNKVKLDKNSWLSNAVVQKVNDHLNKKDQVLFFLNRRGFSPHVFCKKISFCEPIFYGPGVERITEEVKKKFPDKNIAIFSSDTMNKKNSSEILKKIINNEIQILVGTQLISKGFHFPHLNCIIVVDIDLTTKGHDLRGTEKNLQLYHQLSGRAGRAGKPATVYFQTYSNDTNLIKTLTDSEPDIFLSKELQLRKLNNLPPFQRFISIIITGKNEKIIEQESNKFKSFAQTYIKDKILGPVNAPIFRLKRKYRVRLLIRGRKSMKLQNSLSEVISKYKFPYGIKLTVDVDPINFN